MKKTLSVAAIEQGTVIDHIPSGEGIRIVWLYGLTDQKKKVTLGLNLPSRSMKYKDLIKVEDRLITPEEGAQLAIFAPLATVNIISDFQIIKKFKVEMPREVEKIVLCPNRRCITNHESIVTKFYVLPCKDQVRLQCQYCEKSFANVSYKECH